MRFTKGIIFAVLISSIVCSSVMAQVETGSKVYIKIYGGYGLLTPGSYRLESTSYNTTGSTTTGTATISKTGFGSGPKFGGGIGFIVSDFLNIGVDAEYFSGTKVSSTSSYNESSSGYTYLSTSQTQFTYTCISISPHVIFKALSKPNYLIYNKLGIFLNLPFNLNESSSDTASDVQTSYFSNIKDNDVNTYKMNLNVGLNVALGIQFRLTEKLRGFAEIFGNYLVLSPKSSLETYTEKVDAQNGVNPETHDIYVYNDSYTYIKSGTINSSSTSGATSVNGQGYTVHPTTNTSTETVNYNTFNMNSIGLNIGIAYRF